MVDTSRKCNKCLITKPLFSDFYKSGYKNNYRARCKKCENQRNRETYKKTYQTKNRKHLTEEAVHRYQSKKKQAISLFGNQCFDCKQSFPDCVYDFHHLDPLTKDKNIKAIFNLSWNKILIELNKCILLCSNCHRIRHFV